MKKYCTHCGKEIEDYYYKCLDNFLQVSYFDNDEMNCFCSEECFADYCMLDCIELEEEDNVYMD